MIYVLSDDPNEPRWIRAGKTIKEASQKFADRQIKIGRGSAAGGDVFFENAVSVGEYVFIGGGTRICGHAEIEDDAIIATDVLIGSHCRIRKAIVGRRCKIGEFSLIGENAEISDGVRLPPHSIVGDGEKITETEKLAAVFSTGKKIEAFFGSGEIFVFENNPDPSLGSEMTFAEFYKEARIVKLSDAVKKIEKERKLSEISRLVTVLNNIIKK